MGEKRKERYSVFEIEEWRERGSSDDHLMQRDSHSNCVAKKIAEEADRDDWVEENKRSSKC